MWQKPYSQACENNKAPILAVLRRTLTDEVTVWEIGSGTGQHAVHFAAGLPHVFWQPTDLSPNLAGMSLWIDEAALGNLLPPLALDVRDDPWPCDGLEAAFTANSLHIMSWAEVCIFYARLGRYLLPGAIFCSYGPFNVRGEYTSGSNARFDIWLKTQNPLSAIRDIGALGTLADAAGIDLVEDHAMPANNKLLVWRRRQS
jgi:Protein of unknown function (DUF938)